MITAILSALTLFCLCYGRIWLPVLLLLCLSMLLLFHRHEDESRITADMLAGTSRLNRFPPAQKLLFVSLCMFFCILSKNISTGLFLLFVMTIFCIVWGGADPKNYIRHLTLPAVFLMLSSLALLFEYQTVPSGVIQIRFFHGYLVATSTAQANTLLILIKALGSLSCLCFFSLSTPMHEIIGVLNRLRLPKIMIELMYLIYRCIFLLFAMYDTMKAAAKSRLGFSGYFTGIKTLGCIYSNLLGKSYRQAMQMFDAMESRCYEGNIDFLPTSYTPMGKISACMVCITGICFITLL